MFAKLVGTGDSMGRIVVVGAGRSGLGAVEHLARAGKDFVEVRDELAALAQEMGMEIHTQREDVFRYMHRI